MWRQVIGVAARRRLADFDETLLDATLEVSINKTQRDTEFFGDAALRLRAIIDRVEQIEDDPLVLAAIALTIAPCLTLTVEM